MGFYFLLPYGSTPKFSKNNISTQATFFRVVKIKHNINHLMLICPVMKDNILTQMQEGNLMDSMHKQKPARNKVTSYFNQLDELKILRKCTMQGYIQTSEVWPSRTVKSRLGISKGKDVEIGVISIGSTPISNSCTT